jgi:hypothetical protein
MWRPVARLKKIFLSREGVSPLRAHHTTHTQTTHPHPHHQVAPSTRRLSCCVLSQNRYCEKNFWNHLGFGSLRIHFLKLLWGYWNKNNSVLSFSSPFSKLNHWNFPFFSVPKLPQVATKITRVVRVAVAQENSCIWSIKLIHSCEHRTSRHCWGVRIQLKSDFNHGKIFHVFWGTLASLVSRCCAKNHATLQRRRTPRTTTVFTSDFRGLEFFTALFRRVENFWVNRALQDEQRQTLPYRLRSLLQCFMITRRRRTPLFFSLFLGLHAN